MKNFSYAADIFVFFVLLYVFDANWMVAFVVSALVGAIIRWLFVPQELPAAETVETTAERSEGGQTEAAD